MAYRKSFSHDSAVVEIIDDWIKSAPNMSQLEICKAIGVKKSANSFLTQVRAGRSNFPITKAIALSRVLNQNPKVLIEAMLDEYYPDVKEAMLESGILPEEDLVNKV